MKNSVGSRGHGVLYGKTVARLQPMSFGLLKLPHGWLQDRRTYVRHGPSSFTRGHVGIK